MFVMLIYSFCQITILKTCLTSLLLRLVSNLQQSPGQHLQWPLEWLHGFYHEHIFIFTMQMSEKKVLTSHFNNGRLTQREVVHTELNLSVI